MRSKLGMNWERAATSFRPEAMATRRRLSEGLEWRAPTLTVGSVADNCCVLLRSRYSYQP
jgi:hypothetical protein